MTKTQAKQITKYLLELLNYLDGRGIVFEDDTLVKKELKAVESGGYHMLELIIKGEK